MLKFTTADRLKQIMNLRDLRQIDIVRLCEPYCKTHKVKMGRNAISQYVAGKVEPRQNALYILGQALNVSEAWLMGCDVPMERTLNTATEYLENDADLVRYNPIVHRIPVFGFISAGLPLYAEDHIESYTYTERNGGAEYFALKVKGDSMSAAQINEGDIVIVRKQENVENGEIAVVRVEREDATIKRFKRDGDIVQLIPQSFNPKHQIQIYDLKNTSIDVLGKVMECKIEF